VDASLSDFTTTEQGGVLRCLWAEVVKPADIHRNNLAQYGSVYCMSQREFMNGQKLLNPNEKLV
jgi:hypothetical protein